MTAQAKCWRLLIASLTLSFLLGACASSSQAAQPGERQALAMAMWQQRCKSAGEFIHHSVDGVAGIALLKIRTGVNFSNQFRLDDPYGSDSTNDEYLLNFLRGFYHQDGVASLPGSPPRIGYRFVEARDPKDGSLYRYTGRFEEPWLTNKSYLKGYIRFVLDKTPIEAFSARYGVTFDDISTREERELWIAGSSLKVIDLQTQAVIAERVGYMVDAAQGSRARQREPWLFAADNACPDFNRRLARRMPGPAFVAQPGQTLDFVETVLKPAN